MIPKMKTVGGKRVGRTPDATGEVARGDAEGLSLGDSCTKTVKHSDVAPRIEAMVQDAEEHLAAADAMLTVQNRFAPPMRFLGDARRHVKVQAQPHPPLALQWAASYALALRRCYVASPTIAICKAAVCILRYGEVVGSWTVESTYKYTAMMSPVDVTALDTGATVSYTESRVEFKTSVEMFLRHYEACAGGSELTIHFVPIRMPLSVWRRQCEGFVR